jgi:hypothetical protein
MDKHSKNCINWEIWRANHEKHWLAITGRRDAMWTGSVCTLQQSQYLIFRLYDVIPLWRNVQYSEY